MQPSHMHFQRSFAIHSNARMYVCVCEYRKQRMINIRMKWKHKKMGMRYSPTIKQRGTIKRDTKSNFEHQLNAYIQASSLIHMSCALGPVHATHVKRMVE